MLFSVFRLVAGGGSSMLFCFRIGVSCVLIQFCGDMCCWHSGRWVGPEYFSRTARAGHPINNMALDSNTRIEYLVV